MSSYAVKRQKQKEKFEARSEKIIGDLLYLQHQYSKNFSICGTSAYLGDAVRDVRNFIEKELNK